jgi:hypothetical protein
MSLYKPSIAKQIAVVGSLLALALPAIVVAGLSYMYFLEYGLGADMHAKPETLLESAKVTLACFPMTILVLIAILLAGIIWMFIMSRVLSWADIQYYAEQAKQRNARIPWVSDILDRIWEAMLKKRKIREAKQRK